MSQEKVSVIGKFLKSIERNFTPLTDLHHGLIYQIFFLEIRSFQYGLAPVATINEEQLVILPQRFAEKLTTEIIEVVNKGEEKLFFKYNGLKSKGGKTFHLVEFLEKV